MTAPIGIILSISIITALSLAVLEYPQVQAWLEEQRQKIAELLRSIGEELDPQSRRAAEAFAYEGKTPVNEASLRREATGSIDAVARATGRSLSNASTIRRIPVHGPADPDEAEERRRKGREYLAKRNQDMYELRQRRRGRADWAVAPPSPTSFDAMVDDEGKLRLVEQELPSPPTTEPVPDQVKAEMREVERNLVQPILAAGESSSSGWQLGSQLANPFSDEYAMDMERSETPKPPVPPKLALEPEEESRAPTMPGGFDFDFQQPEPQPSQVEDGQEDLTYEEQLAIALSLSEAESASNASQRQSEDDDEDADLRMAIEASLKDMPNQRPATPLQALESSQPLVDLTPPSPMISAQQPTPRGHWETLFDQDYSPNREPLSLAPSQAVAVREGDEDELYRVTPELTRARLASLNAEQIPAPTSSTNSSAPYDPVREAAGQTLQPQQAPIEAGFYSAASSAPSPASMHTVNHEPVAQLIDISESAPAEGARTPTSRPLSSFGFQTDSEDSDSDTFASISEPVSRAESRPRGEISGDIEVVDVLEDSDVDMLSEEGDGIATPDSWTEVGSRDGESEMEEDVPQRQRASL